MDDIRLPGKLVPASKESFIKDGKMINVLFAVKQKDGTYSNNYFLNLSHEAQVRLGKLIEVGIVYVWEPNNTALWDDSGNLVTFGD